MEAGIKNEKSIVVTEDVTASKVAAVYYLFMQRLV